MFGFGDDENKVKDATFNADHPADIGNPLENDRSGPTVEALASATAGIAKRGRGRPKGTGAKPPVGPASGAQNTQIMLDKLFDPKLWGPLVTMPADAMLAMTGHKHWDLSDTERTTLATTATTAAQYLGIQNPKTLALSLLLINLAMVYTPRAVKEFAMIKADRETKAKENRHGS